MPTVKYRNESAVELDVIGLDKIPPGGEVSFSGQFLPPVILANYPGLIEVTEETIDSTPVATPEPTGPTLEAEAPAPEVLSE